MQTTNTIRAAITAFAEDLAVLIKQSVEQDVRAALSAEPERRSSAPTDADEDSAWPIAGTNCFQALAVLRAHPEGMLFGDLMAAVGIARKPLGKALDKLRAHQRVRTVGRRRGMRYFASVG